MKISRLKNSITLFFLALFLMMKMGGLHVLVHTDDSDHDLDCIICDHTITHNLTPILNPDLQDFSIENIKFLVQIETAKNYTFIISSTIASYQLFSRPPPFLL